MKTAVVTIAGKPYTIREPKRKANAKWRQRFQAEFSDVAALIEYMKTISANSKPAGGDKK